MADIPRFTIMPAPRCCEITSSAPLTVCNRPARWMPVLAALGVTAFWCDEHKKGPAMPIAGEPIVRRVSVMGQMVLGSAVATEQLARAEALARLARGIASVGGLLNLHVINCQTGPWAAPPQAGNENGDGDGPRGG